MADHQPPPPKIPILHKLMRWKISNMSQVYVFPEEQEALGPKISGTWAGYMVWRRWTLMMMMIFCLGSLALQFRGTILAGQKLYTSKPCGGQKKKNNSTSSSTNNIVMHQELWRGDVAHADFVLRAATNVSLDACDSCDDCDTEPCASTCSLCVCDSCDEDCSFSSYCNQCDGCLCQLCENCDGSCGVCDFCNCGECEDCNLCPYCEGCEDVCDECGDDCQACPNCPHCAVCDTCGEDDCPERCFKQTDDAFPYQPNFITRATGWDPDNKKAKWVFASNIFYLALSFINLGLFVYAIIAWKDWRTSSKALIASYIVKGGLTLLFYFVPAAYFISGDVSIGFKAVLPSYKTLAQLLLTRVQLMFEVYQKVFPISLSIIPALAKANYVVLTLFPESSLCGMFVNIFNLMKIPLSLGNVLMLYQLLADLFLMAFCVCLGLNMLCSVIPLRGYNFGKALPDANEVQRRATMRSRVGLVFLLMALVFLVLFLVNVFNPFVTAVRKVDYDDFTNFIPFPGPTFIIRMFFDFFFKMMLGAVTLADVVSLIMFRMTVQKHRHGDLAINLDKRLDEYTAMAGYEDEMKGTMELKTTSYTS